VKTEFDQFGDFIHSGEILGGQKIGSVAKIFGFSIDLKTIREAACLGALPAVGATSPEDFTGQALA
jgi:hypothetical protein